MIIKQSYNSFNDHYKVTVLINNKNVTIFYPTKEYFDNFIDVTNQLWLNNMEKMYDSFLGRRN